LALANRTPGAWQAGVLAITGFLAYAASPFSAQGPPGQPSAFFFAANLRYTLAPITLAGIAMALSMADRSPRARWLLLVGVTAGWLVAAWRGTNLPFERVPPEPGVLALSVAAAVLGGGAIAGVRWAWRGNRSVLIIAAPIVFIATALVGWQITDRYVALGPASGGPAFRNWLNPLHGRRIGDIGFARQYVLMGRDVDNHVRWIVSSRPHGGVVAPPDCRTFRTLVNRGRYDFVVVGPVFYYGPGDQPAVAWLRSDGSAELVVDEASTWVFAIHAPLDARACGSAAEQAS
jgi:hypothetical protein